jgi:Cu/Ag efflux pump CusA
MIVGGLALVPLLVLDPVSTAFTRPLVATFVVACVVSLVVEMTVVPALVVLLMRRAPTSARSPAQRLARAFERPARSVTATRWMIWPVAFVLVAIGLTAVPQLTQRSFVPVAHDLDVLLHVDTVPGTSLTEANRVGSLISQDVRTVPGVREVGGHVGRAVTSDQLGDVNSGELWISFDESADYATARAGVERVVARYPGVRARLVSYWSDQVDLARPGSSADVTVRILGPDLAALQTTADAAATAMSRVADVSGARVVPIRQQPTVQVAVDLAAAQRYGLRPGDIRREATTLASGLTVGNLYEQAKVFDVVVLGTPTTRANVTALGDIRIDTPSGDQVRLGELAKISVTPQPASIVHDSVQRSVDVVASLSGRNAAATVAAVEAAVSSVPVPPEAHFQVISAAADRAADVRRLLVVALAVLLAMVLVLQAATASWRRAAVLVLLAPLGGVGTVVIAPLVGGVGTLGPALAALAAVLLTVFSGLAYVRAITAAAQASRDDLAAQRALSIMRTGLLLVLAALPAVLLGDRPGTEVLRPFAASLIGGVVTSVLVVLVLVPVLAGLRRGAER